MRIRFAYAALLLAAASVRGLESNNEPPTAWSFEAGAGYVFVSGAHYETNPDPAIRREDQRAWSPYVGVAAKISPTVAVRAAYQFIGGLETDAIYPYPPGPGTTKPMVVTPARYHSDIHVGSIGVQLQKPLTGRIAVFVTPALDWVFERGEVTYFSGPGTARNRNALRVGATLGIHYQLERRWTADLGYRYIDAQPSWSRQLHALNLGFTFH
ncbi:MAG TPA: hypothetical protein VHE61_23350 [Opitutaceae bacterium]|nr:hypothetical protein [Opitutaceae bacterium]